MLTSIDEAGTGIDKFLLSIIKIKIVFIYRGSNLR
jgi:hypothetical protein